MLGSRRLVASLAVGLLLAQGLPLGAAADPVDMGFGMSAGSLSELTAQGATPAYASYWAGEWLSRSGWAGVDNALKTAKSAGVTPVVYWYYWGDSISPSCIENGCNDRTKAEWSAMTTTLAQHVRDVMGGAPTYIVLENEFNKGGITDPSYAPTFDTYLEAVAKELKAVPGVQIVLGYGAWGEDAWGRFPKSIAASDMIGFQLMRASTRDTEATYRGADDKIASVLAKIRSLSPGKNAFLYDVALSSYPDATWRAVQAETLQSIVDRRLEYASNGLVGLVYREIRDNPSMGTHNYYGIAEQYWGFKDINESKKPAYPIWIAAVKAQTAPPPPPPPAPAIPARFEAEAMAASAGGRQADAAASGGAVWNLWSNGELSQRVLSPGGAFRATIVARGSLAGGVMPAMELRLDGARVASWSVPSGALQSFVADIQVPAGNRTLSVAFTNDALVNGEDRNLIVDVLRVETPPAPNRAPVASFAHDERGPRVTLDASASSDPDGDALSFSWDLGDGSSASGASVAHDYPAPGEYVVRLAVSDGKATAFANATIRVIAPNAAPVASFELVGQDLTWRVDASSSSDPDGDPLAFAWDFGDGGTAAEVVATHVYEPGGYTITLTVTDPSGAAAVATRALAATAPNRAPNASFASAGDGLSWSFDASASSDPDGDALSYAWDLGDGSTASGATVAHAYAPGSYVVTLTASDGRLSSTSQATITVVQPNRAPVASFAAAGAGLAWSFDASGSSDADGDALSYAWDFGDGASASGALAAHTFAPGTYVVTLTVSDGAASASQQQTIDAIQPNRAPQASFVATGAELTWTLDASASSDEDGDALTYAWDLGDGRSATGALVKVTYATGGDKLVTLTVSDGEASAQASRTVAAREPAPPAPPASAAYHARQAEEFAQKDNGARFADSSAQNGSAWLLWSNGAISQPFAPGAGTYRVEIVARGDVAGKVWPAMELRADGQRVAAFTAGSATWRTYSALVTFGPGETRTLSVAFTNDAMVSGQDRNLRIDAVRLVGASAYEAEAFERKDNGARFTDAAASGGAGWLLWSNGAITQAVASEGGAYAIEVVAKGDQAAGAPKMEIRVDGVVVARVDVSATSWQTYRTTTTMSPGAHTLSVAFTNDHRNGSIDRNLRVDVVRLVPT